MILVFLRIPFLLDLLVGVVLKCCSEVLLLSITITTPLFRT
jgi:hypothetical protein